MGWVGGEVTAGGHLNHLGLLSQGSLNEAKRLPKHHRFLLQCCFCNIDGEVLRGDAVDSDVVDSDVVGDVVGKVVDGVVAGRSAVVKRWENQAWYANAIAKGKN